MALAYLLSALAVALRPLFPFQQAQYAQVFRLKPAPFCTLFASLGSTNKSAIFLLRLSDSRSVLATLPSALSFTLNSVADLAGTVFFLLLFYQATIGPRTLVTPGNDTADEVDRRGALLAPSAIPCSLSPLISCIHSSLFSDWRHTVSSKFFDSQVPSISTKKLVLPRLARYVLCLRCNGHCLLLSSFLFRIGSIENSSCSACGHSSQDTSHLILHCPATDPAPLTLR